MKKAPEKKPTAVSETAKKLDAAHHTLVLARKNYTVKLLVFRSAEDRVAKAEDAFEEANKQHTEAVRKLK